MGAQESTDETRASAAQDGELSRTLGLPAALAVGVGTMVGAGIFVFPGLVAAQMGPAGIFAFALSGLLALVVAVYTAELATALPVSGGSYSMIERGLGTWLGRVMGLAQWAGLVFASAFYLSAFADYAGSLATRLGLGTAGWALHLGAAGALVLTAVVVFGGERAGQFQKVAVIALTLMLTALFTWGLWRVLGDPAALPGPERFVPREPLSLFSTAAMIFTAYIGFVQIAAVGGEIRNPDKNLPRSLVGSVGLVMVLYGLVFFVTASLLSDETLARVGETATVEAGEVIAGAGGVAVVMGAGLLATLSSANASILSASRTLFALARDGAVPRRFRRVGLRSGSPWIAVLATGLPAAGLAYLGAELLAEVASLLHLVIYGLICFAILPSRRRSPDWFTPSFQAPGPAFIAAAAGVLCFGLVAFMSDLALITGGVVGVACLLALLTYHAFARD